MKVKTTQNKVSFVIFVIILALFLSLFVFIYTHEYYPVKGQSMYPTINSSGTDTNGVYVDTNNKGEFQDVVVATTEEGTTVIKRIMGFDGDLVGFIADENGDVYFYRIPNGEENYEDCLQSFKVEESYLKSIQGNKQQQEAFEIMLSKQIENKVFVMDKVNQKFYEFYQVPQNKVFLMGDNRGNTTDSSTKYGGIPYQNIIGKVDYMVVNNYFQVFEILFKIITFKGSNIWKLV